MSPQKRDIFSMNDDQKTVLVSGALGAIGQPFCQLLEEKGHRVRRLSRGNDGDVRWDVEAGTMDAGAMKGVDVVVHLAGERVAQRWTAASKERILNSRVKAGDLLVKEILKQPIPPTYITASGVHYYGNQAGGGVSEQSPQGEGFMATVCSDWETVAQPLIDAGVRVVYARLGVVLSARAGVLYKMLPPFRVGLGGPIGSGKQLMSWISLEDVTQILCMAVEDASVHGPLNVVAPQPVTNAIFSKTLGNALNRPTLVPMPEMVVKALWGAMGKEVLCSDLGAVPQVLIDRNYQWRYPSLTKCIEACVADEF
jgi:uncharacterized protein (TIGR01777 family)